MNAKELEKQERAAWERLLNANRDAEFIWRSNKRQFDRARDEVNDAYARWEQARDAWIEASK